MLSGQMDVRMPSPGADLQNQPIAADRVHATNRPEISPPRAPDA
jgi:hypothetical protein